MAKILVVDDDQAIRGLVKEVLEFDNHQVVTAVNGKEGLKTFIKAGDFAMVFTDGDMPEMNGHDLKDAIHDHEKGAKTTPVVLITGNHNGFAAELPKPFDSVRVLIALANVLSSL